MNNVLSISDILALAVEGMSAYEFATKPKSPTFQDKVNTFMDSMTPAKDPTVTGWLSFEDAHKVLSDYFRNNENPENVPARIAQTNEDGDVVWVALNLIAGTDPDDDWPEIITVDNMTYTSGDDLMFRLTIPAKPAPTLPTDIHSKIYNVVTSYNGHESIHNSMTRIKGGWLVIDSYGEVDTYRDEHIKSFDLNADD